MTTFSTSLRLWEGTPGDPAIKDAWGVPLNTNDNLIEAAILGTATINIGGLTSWTLTAANGAADQSRPLVQYYIGALTGTCTVKLQNVPKVGYARNGTTGGHNVILTAGAGTTATIPPDGQWYLFWADGSMGANVTLIPVGLGSLNVSGAVAVGGVVTAANGTTSNQVVNFSQFAQSLGPSGSISFPGGFTFKWGVATALATNTGSTAVAVTFAVAFPTSIYASWAVPNGPANSVKSGVPSVMMNAETRTGTTVVLDTLGYTTFNQNVQVKWFAIGN